MKLPACQSLPNHAMQKRVAVMAGASVSAEVDNRVGNSALEPCVSLPLYQLVSGERRIFVTQHILHRDFMLLRQERLVRKFHLNSVATRGMIVRVALFFAAAGVGARGRPLWLVFTNCVTSSIRRWAVTVSGTTSCAIAMGFVRAGAAGLVTVGTVGLLFSKKNAYMSQKNHRAIWLQCWFKVSDYTDAQAAVNIALWLLTPFPQQQPRDLSNVRSSTAVCQPPTPTRTVMTGARATHNEDNPVGGKC